MNHCVSCDAHVFQVQKEALKCWLKNLNSSKCFIFWRNTRGIGDYDQIKQELLNFVMVSPEVPFLETRLESFLHNSCRFLCYSGYGENNHALSML
jgi:hypothetical protein